MFEGTDSVFDTESVPSNISYKSFETYNLPMQNSYCDHRNFDSVNQPSKVFFSNGCGNSRWPSKK
jgi:hypothetical protein